MKILFISNRFWPYIGGVERLAAKLVEDLGSEDYEFRVVTSHAELELPDCESYRGATVHRYGFQQALSDGVPMNLIKLRRDLEKAIIEFSPDLIHLHAIGPVVFFLNPIVDKLNVPMVLTLHSHLLPSQIGSNNTMVSETLLKADWVASCSAAALEEACELVPPIRERSSVIRNAFNLGDFVPRAVPTRPMSLLCLGRLVPVKGFDIAISVLRTINERFPEVRLQLAGEGPERAALEQQVERFGLRDNVDFLGQVPPDRVADVIDRASIVLMPSITEGLPIAAIETAMVGRPLIATRVGGNPEIVVHGETGLLTEPGSLEDFTRSTVSLLEAPEKAQRMGAAARVHALKQFGWSTHLEAHRVLYTRHAVSPTRDFEGEGNEKISANDTRTVL
jgi:glycogen(starch) synthase